MPTASYDRRNRLSPFCINLYGTCLYKGTPINKAEKELGFSLTKRSTGGRSGGGSTLTPEGKEWLKKYETYRNACNEANSKLYMEIFSD